MPNLEAPVASTLHHAQAAQPAAVGEQVAMSRPPGLWFLTAILLASPVIHGAALLLGPHWLNYGSPRAWDAFVYISHRPLRRHPDAPPL